MKNPFENKWLRLHKDVMLGTETTSFVICLLDKYFERAKTVAYVTSILRDPVKQLQIIIDYAKKYKLPVNFTKTDVDTKTNARYYVWQHTWSKLLSLGVIISPPRPAICLEDYIVGGVNKKGAIIMPSPHFTGKAFDIGGGKEGVLNKLEILKNAMSDQEIRSLIKRYLIEHNNNCIHIDVI